MHSSRMLTVRCSSCLPRGRGCLPWGGVCPEGVCPGCVCVWGVLCQTPPVYRMTDACELKIKRIIRTSCYCSQTFKDTHFNFHVHEIYLDHLFKALTETVSSFISELNRFRNRQSSGLCLLLLTNHYLGSNANNVALGVVLW